MEIGTILIFFIPCFLFVYNLVAAISKDRTSDETPTANILVASAALCAIVFFLAVLS